MLDIRTLCLGILSHREATGYEIKKLFQRGALAPFLEASFGSIYPALTRLTKDGLVSYRSEVQEKRPDKKVYSITQKGLKTFKSTLQMPPEEDKFRSDFLFISIFADLIPLDHLRHVIDLYIERRQHQAARITEEMEAANSPGALFVSGLCKLSCDLTVQYIEDNRHLLEKVAQQSVNAKPKTHRIKSADRVKQTVAAKL